MIKKTTINSKDGPKIVQDKNTRTIKTEARTMLSLSLTVNDKRSLKLLAMKKELTIAKLIHNWIVEHENEIYD